MARREIIVCDACGDDITEGHGRMWHLQLHSCVTAMAKDKEPRHDAGAILPMHNFCDEHCLADWALKSAAAKDAGEAAHIEELKAGTQKPPAD